MTPAETKPAHAPAPADAQPPNSHGTWARWAMLLGLVALVGLFALSDGRELWRAAQGIDLKLLVLPFGLAVLSYVVMALSYQGIARAAGTDVPFGTMLRITFVSNTVNYIVSTGGISGLAVRIYFFVRLGMPSGTAVIVALVQTFITNSVLLIFVATGFGFLLRSNELHGPTLWMTTGLLGIFVVAAVSPLMLLIHRGVRRRTLFWLAEVTNSVLHRVAPKRKPARVRIWRFQRNLNRGIEFVLSQKGQMVVPTLWIFVDWVVTLMILYTAFVAVRYPVPPSFVVVGFAVGIIMSLISFVPAGLGVMEGSMAAVFRSLGVPFETAVIAALVFRLSYYIMPLVVSVFFFRGMLEQSREVVTEPVPEQTV
jgi:glycosyltransferase 2 family protein